MNGCRWSCGSSSCCDVFLERVAELRAQDVYVALICAAQIVSSTAGGIQRVHGRGARTEIDGRVLDEQMREAHVDHGLLGHAVLRPEREPRPVLVRYAWRALRVRSGPLVECDAEPHRPRTVHVVIGPRRYPPRVLEVERKRLQRGAAVAAYDGHRFDVAPLSPGYVTHELPLGIDRVENAPRCRCRQLDFRGDGPVGLKRRQCCRPALERHVAAQPLLDGRPIGDADARVLVDAEQRAEIVAPGIVVTVQLDGTFLGRIGGYRGDCRHQWGRYCAGTQQERSRSGVVGRPGELRLRALKAEPRTEGYRFVHLKSHAGIDVDRLDFRLETVETPDPAGVVFRLQSEWRVETYADEPTRTELPAQIRIGYERPITGVSAVTT